MSYVDDAICEEPEEHLRNAEGPANDPDSADLNWKEYNLLSLDGGGIRGYWSLLALNKLMDVIADIEEKGEIYHSFAPQDFPENVSQGPFTEEESQRLSDADQAEPRCRALSRTRRYLPCHYFDYICGTSTGALIAIMLGRFRMTVPDCLHEYQSLGGEIFGNPRFFTQIRFGLGHRTKYNGGKLKRVFEEVTARRSEQTDSRITFPFKRGLCKTFVITIKEEAGKQEVATAATPYLIRSYDHDKRTTPSPSRTTTRRSTRRATRSNTETSGEGVSITRDREGVKLRRKINYGNAQQFHIWEVARAATAAPFYFEPLKIGIHGSPARSVFTDAGFGYTINPTEEGALEIEELYGASSIGVIVSVGTARGIQPLRGGIRRMVKGIANTAANAEVVHEKLKQKSANDGFPYYRLDNPGALNVELDEWKPKRKPFRNDFGSTTIKTIRDAFNDWGARTETGQQFERCAKELVRRRQARTKDLAKWERYAIGAQFRCQLKGCEREDFDNRREFGDHLSSHHEMAKTDLDGEANKCKKHWRYRRAASRSTR